MSLSLVDSHCHIPMIEMDGGVAAILHAAKQSEVEQMLCVNIDIQGYATVQALAAQYQEIVSSVGIHPNTLLEKEISTQDLVRLGADPGIVAIGETGLDYFRSSGDLDWQRDRFKYHIHAARETGKPLIVHCREAKEDVLSILEAERANDVGGVMHCFVEDLDTAKRAMDLNFYISFSGIVTFKNATTLQDVARQIPDHALLIETDSPYLAPVPYRGKQNQPAYVRYVAEFLAELRGVSLQHLAQVTTSNFNKLFLK